METAILLCVFAVTLAILVILILWLAKLNERPDLLDLSRPLSDQYDAANSGTDTEATKKLRLFNNSVKIRAEIQYSLAPKQCQFWWRNDMGDIKRCSILVPGHIVHPVDHIHRDGMSWTATEVADEHGWGEPPNES